MPDKTAQDAGLSAKQEIMRLIKWSVDRLLSELKELFTRLDDENRRFGFLLNVQELLTEPESSDSIIKESCNRIGNLYNTDVESKGMYIDVIYYRVLLKSRTNTSFTDASNSLSLSYNTVMRTFFRTC